MATTLKLRRGTDTQHSTFTGAEGEVTFNTTTEVLHIHDGITAGGHPLAKADLTNAIVAGHLIPDTDVTYDLGSSSYKFRDIYLSGSTINLGGATISQDASSGTIALVAAPTDDVPNPTALVITSEGATVAVDTTGGDVDFDDVATEIASNPGFDGAYSSLTGVPSLTNGALIHQSSTVTHTVTVASKDSNHRYNGTGSANGYKIDDTFSPTLRLVPGNTYRFDQADATNSGHPLLFYYEADKTTAYTSGVTTNGTPGSSGAYTEIVVDNATPSVLHYQCSAHSYMGNQAFTFARNLTGFDTDDISEGSTNEYYTDAKVDARISAATIDADTLNAENPSHYLDYNNFTNTPTIPSALTDLGITDGTADQVLTTDGSGNFTFEDASGGGGASVTVSDTAPSSPSAGDLWWDSTSLTPFIYYSDGSSNQWVEFANPDSGGASFDGAYSSLTGTPTIPSALTDLGITDGTADQVLTTDGAGSFTFADASGGASVTVSDTAPSSPSAGDLWWDSTSLTPYIYYSDGSSDQWVEFANPDSGGSSSGGGSSAFIKAYRYDDTLAVNTGSKRLYLHDSFTLDSIDAFIDTAPAGAAATIDLIKNGAGSAFKTITIADGATSSVNNTDTTTFSEGDYITVNITQVGSTTAGTNLYLVFSFS